MSLPFSITLTSVVTPVRCELPSAVSKWIQRPEFPIHLRRFIHNHITSSYLSLPIPDSDLPNYNNKLDIYTSAISLFYAPSNLSGVSGMHRERIRAMPSWRKGPTRYDTVLINKDDELEGMQGMEVARVRLFFSFIYEERVYPCAYVNWYTIEGDAPDADMGMWIATPDQNHSAVIHLDAIICCAHLIPVFGKPLLPPGLNFANSLDSFRAFYVSKYADHHMYEIVH